MNKINERSITSLPHSELITLEALRAAVKAVGLSEDSYRLRVSIVPVEPVRELVRKIGVGFHRENGQNMKRVVVITSCGRSGDYR